MGLISRASLCVKAYAGLSGLNHRTESLVDHPKELVSQCFGYTDAFLQPVQIPEEMVSLLEDVKRLNPKRILEIGTCKGGSLYLWTRIAQSDATIVSVDLPGGKFGGGYSRLRTPIYKRFARRGQRLHLLRTNSHLTDTLENVKRLFGGSEIDFLFIDGDHTYEGVKRDWEMYSTLVRKGGLIAFHDVAGNYGETQAKRCWDAIKGDFTHREYLAHPEGLYGIGVLFK
jgi:predicted O-methyltransferase YrrM